MSVLDDDLVCSMLAQVWEESRPGTTNAHEEGRFVLRSTDGTLSVERWPTGAQNQIVVPPHSGGQRQNQTIVATFHTHPNPGQNFQQEPSLTDIRAVRDDPDLAHTDYEGEFVIAAKSVYCIRRSGEVDTIGETTEVLNIK